MIVRFCYWQKQYYAGIIECLRQLYVLPDNYILDAFLAKKLHQSKVIYIYLDNDQVLGTASVFLEPKIGHDDKFAIHIEDVCVVQSKHGCGIGSELIDFIINKYKGLAYKYVLVANSEVKLFYEKLGFKEVGHSMRLDI